MPRLEPPVDPARDHVSGSDSAPTLLEYGDFECPYCAQAYVEVKRAQRRLGDGVRFVFREFPLDKHPHARDAALAAEAAALQGRFWEMHDKLFEARGRLSRADLAGYAEQLGLDMTRFERDLDSRELAARVDEDFRSGLESGVDGTPSFYLDGERYDGYYGADALVAAIEGER
jgi:Na+:H+ antiporter, NhaA family